MAGCVAAQAGMKQQTYLLEMRKQEVLNRKRGNRIMSFDSKHVNCSVWENVSPTVISTAYKEPIGIIIKLEKGN